VRAWGRERKGEMHGAMAGEMEGIAKKKNPTIEKKIGVVKICKNWLGNEQRALKRAAKLADRSRPEIDSNISLLYPTLTVRVWGSTAEL
jgi:hypothetical protein